MGYGKIINGIKYMCLHNDNNFKQLSLEDNVYFTLRDIFLNGDSVDIILKANEFNAILTNGIYFEERTENFTYSNMLDDAQYLYNLIRWLKNFSESYFEFVEPDDKIDMCDYIKFDDWWIQFKTLLFILDNKYQAC